jgi:predicted transcriptional regulator
MNKGEKVRKNLLDCVRQNPGIRFLELGRMTGMSNGRLSYHLEILEKSKILRVDRSPRSARYYVASFPDNEAAILNVIRQGAKGRIVGMLLQRESCTFRELVDLCKRAPSTVSSQLASLKKSGIITSVYGRQKSFMISSYEVSRIIRKHLKSLPDMTELA